MVNNKKIFELEDHLDRFYNSLKLLRIEPPMQRDELTKTLNELVSQLDSDAPHMLYWQSTRAVAHRMHAFPKGGKASLMAFSEPCGLDRQDHPYKLISVETPVSCTATSKRSTLSRTAWRCSRLLRRAVTRSFSTAATA